MPVTVTDNTGTILVDDGAINWYIKKQKVVISTDGDNVIIRADEVHYVSYPYSDFTSPSGASAAAVAAGIEAFLDS